MNQEDQKKTRGQIPILQLIGIGSAILIAVVGGFLVQSRYTDGKIDVVRTDNTMTVQRVATLEEAVKTIKDDNAEIKRDVKELLRRSTK